MERKTFPHTLSHVTIKQLRAVAAATQARTIAGAANLLNVTPPAVSLQLRLIEESVGIPLFDRTQEGMLPTDAGNEILQAAQRVEAVLADCSQSLEALQSGTGGHVSVGVVSTAKYFAPAILAAFRSTYPDIKLEIVVGNRDMTIQALDNFTHDLTIMGRPPEFDDIEIAPIGPHPHVIVAPNDHPLAQKNGLNLKEVGEEQFLVREEGSGTRLLMERLFDEAQVLAKHQMEIGSNETIKQAVIAGLGIAFISAHTVAMEATDGRLKVLDVVGLPVMRTWYAAHRSSKHMLPAAQLLWDFIVTEGEKYLPVYK